MLKLRKSEERGHADHGWLKSFHTFSFADYRDPQHMGYRSLRVINEDKIQPGMGFGMHPHRDMEIITYVVSGALEHKDSMGSNRVIQPGEVQRMSAGTGVVHSEFNPTNNQVAHIFQIWIIPKSRGGKPRYDQKSFDDELKSKDLVLVVSENGRDGSFEINQDADVYISRLKSGKEIEYSIRQGRGLWLQMISGRLKANGAELKGSDALAVEQDTVLKIAAEEDSEFILFDLD